MADRRRSQARRKHETGPIRVVIVGGGVAALEAMLALRRLAGDRVSVLLVAPEREFIYRPLVVGEPFGLGRAHRFDLAALAAGAGAELVNSRVVAVDSSEHCAFTEDGTRIDYDKLIAAPGARMRLALPGALTFWGVADADEVTRLLVELESGEVDRVVFAVHAAAGWPLPLYELALMTSAHLVNTDVEGRRLTVVTYEDAPLGIFGPTASSHVRELLGRRDIELIAGRHPAAVAEGALEIVPGGSIPADRVITLPRLEGPRLSGLPADEHGFIPVDPLGRVRTATDVYAAGDATTFAVKQGGLAAQQAYSVATAVASAAGAPLDPEPFRPVLRGVLMTGGAPSFMRTELRGGLGDTSTVSLDALWWPPGKVAGRFLAPHLAEVAGQALAPPTPVNGATLPIEIELAA
ncbi:MAG TPA: FAD-dependent oxidoreductase [Solirubrobacterales bacterium]|nr:FAD-dependent oxidoreductase [Solirubrobacterales bacterium]